MVDETLYGEDYFNDADLADAENLPTGPTEKPFRYVGYVSKIDVSQAEPGQYRKFEANLIAKSAKLAKALAGRTEIPQISVSITAIAKAGERAFPDDTNYYKTSDMDFWVGGPDRIGRHSLARLVRDASGKTEEEIKAMPIREAAKLLDKVYLTFEVKHRKFAIRSGGEGVAQDFYKIKPATAEEVQAVL